MKKIKMKNNLIKLWIFDKYYKNINIVIYNAYIEPILNILLKNYKKQNIDININKKEIYIDHSELKEEYQHLHDKDLNNYILSLIFDCKKANRNYRDYIKEKQNSIILSTYVPDSLIISYQTILNKEKFKKFILYLIKEYCINKKLAYSFYKTGIQNHMFVFNFNYLFDNANETLNLFYKSKDNIYNLYNEVFNRFYKYLNKIN